MKKIKIKLSYKELLELDNFLNTEMTVAVMDHADKAISALLLEYSLKSIKPHTYLFYEKKKSINLSIPVSYALVHKYEYTQCYNYQQVVMYAIISTIQPKLK